MPQNPNNDGNKVSKNWGAKPKLDNTMDTLTNNKQPMPTNTIVVLSDEEDPVLTTSKGKSTTTWTPSIIHILSNEENPVLAMTSKTKMATLTTLSTNAPATRNEAKTVTAMNNASVGWDMLMF